MITPAQVTRRATLDGVSPRAVERDYVLALVLQEIGDQADDRLVFKGGTSLRFCYAEEFRYSADLDFSVVEEGSAAARVTVEVGRAKSEA